MRTTCVATMLAAGVAENALPRSAKATVNCRILPGMTPAQVESTLREVVADDEIQLRRIGGGAPSPPSPVRDDVMQAVRELSREFWGEVSVAPYQGTGATDGLWLRLAGTPVYGLGARFGMAGETRAHGLDERLRVDSFHQSVRFWYALLKRFSQ
jgi:acetylornithine deacetylase/succinyl-diaminopimelate desuccinylase-like protein